jgi:small conductance mechanosensitive channel
LQKLVANNENIIQEGDKAPIIRVDALADSSVNLLVRYWTKRADFQETKWALTEQTKLCFDDNDIEIPFPQRSLHIEQIPTQLNVDRK